MMDVLFVPVPVPYINNNKNYRYRTCTRIVLLLPLYLAFHFRRHLIMSLGFPSSSNLILEKVVQGAMINHQ
jgi:hypothetical protein